MYAVFGKEAKTLMLSVIVFGTKEAKRDDTVQVRSYRSCVFGEIESHV